MENFRYVVLVEAGDELLDIARFRTKDTATLFLDSVKEKFRQFTFSLDDIYKERSLSQLIEDEVFLVPPTDPIS